MIRNADEKERAELVDNRLVEGAGFARDAFDRVYDAKSLLENIDTGIPNSISNRVDALIDTMESLEKELRQTIHELLAQRVAIEDEINAYEKEAV